MNIVLVRHGQTDWNVKNMLQGRTNIELNCKGKEQAKETAKKLANIKIDKIYVSPLKRTIETSKQINKNRNIETVIDNRLIERGFGEFEGKSNIDIKKYWDYENNLSNNEIEPIKDLFSRVYSLLEDIYELYKDTDKTILLVTHNGVNLALTSIIKGMISNIFEYNLKPCEYRIFENVDLNELEEFCGRYKI